MLQNRFKLLFFKLPVNFLKSFELIFSASSVYFKTLVPINYHIKSTNFSLGANSFRLLRRNKLSNNKTPITMSEGFKKKVTAHGKTLRIFYTVVNPVNLIAVHLRLFISSLMVIGLFSSRYCPLIHFILYELLNRQYERDSHDPYDNGMSIKLLQITKGNLERFC